MIIDKLQTGIYIDGQNRLTLNKDGGDPITINEGNQVHMEFTNFLIEDCPTKSEAVLITMRYFRFKPWSVWIIKQILRILN